MASPDEDLRLGQALQQWFSDQPSAVAQLVALAEAGDVRAQAAAAYGLMHLQRQTEALEWAERAERQGFAFIGWWVGQQLAGHGDAALRHRAAELVARSFSVPGTGDPFGPALQLAQQGSHADAIAVLDGALGASVPWRQQLEAATQQATEVLGAIRTTEELAGAERDRIVGRLQAMAATGQAELESLQRLGQEVGEIAHDRAADYLKKGYEAEASKVQRRADLATVVSIVLAVAIAVAAIIIATRLPAKDTLSEAVEKAAFSVPLLALNAYIGRLAHVYREEALRWRHIKLQIQTANPFLGALDEAQRKETLALLATRFFPGQPMPLPNKAAEPSDVSGALASMFQPAAAGAKVTVEPSPGATPASAG